MIKIQGKTLVCKRITPTGISVENVKPGMFRHHERVRNMCVEPRNSASYLISQAKAICCPERPNEVHFEIEAMTRESRRTHIQLLNNSSQVQQVALEDIIRKSNDRTISDEELGAWLRERTQ